MVSLVTLCSKFLLNLVAFYLLPYSSCVSAIVFNEPVAIAGLSYLEVDLDSCEDMFKSTRGGLPSLGLRDLLEQVKSCS